MFDRNQYAYIVVFLQVNDSVKALVQLYEDSTRKYHLETLQKKEIDTILKEHFYYFFKFMNLSKCFKIIDLSQIEKKCVKIASTDAYYILTTLVDHDDLD